MIEQIFRWSTILKKIILQQLKVKYKKQLTGPEGVL